MISLTIAAALSASLPGAFDAAQACVLQKADSFEKAGEAADVTVEAAFAACLKEIADLRVATYEFIKASSPTLSEASVKSAEEKSFEVSRSSIHGKAIVSIVETRAANARN